MANQLALVLHTHLPFVRHPEYDRFYEEQWLFEAVAESYLPLLGKMEEWSRDGVDWRLSLSMTPPLCAMLEDSLLISRIERYLVERLELAQAECARWLLVPSAKAAAEFSRDRYQWLCGFWTSIGGRLLPVFRGYMESGHLEILCCAATHALLPVIAASRTSLAAQIELGVAEHRRHFGRNPNGIWLPECGYSPDLDEALANAGLQWFVVESHAFWNAQPQPSTATFRPVVLPSGLVAFPRDQASARVVWSRQGGYPGDPRYREFHRDIADDGDWEYVQRYLPRTENRVASGVKLHRITGSDCEKEWYDRSQALGAVQEHAEGFVALQTRSCGAASAFTEGGPLVISPFDTELFGHWWFEGPEFLDAIVRRLGASDSVVRLTTPGSYLAEKPTLETCQIGTTTWGLGGHAAVWLDSTNGWIQPLLRPLERRLAGLAARLRGTELANTDPRGVLLDQAARELLLAQASDWPFLLKMGTAGDYPARRVRDHVAAAHRLLEAVSNGSPVMPAELEFARERGRRFNLFPTIDARSLFGRE